MYPNHACLGFEVAKPTRSYHSLQNNGVRCNSLTKTGLLYLFFGGCLPQALAHVRHKPSNAVEILSRAGLALPLDVVLKQFKSSITILAFKTIMPNPEAKGRYQVPTRLSGCTYCLQR